MIDSENAQLGVVATVEALRLSREKDLDLVEISPNGNPPVCKIMDFGKFKYAQSKKDRESHKKRKTQHLKEVKLKPKIDPHDFQTKSKLVERMVAEGDKVKVMVVFRGREIMYAEHAQKLLDKLAQGVSEQAFIEKPAKLEGRSLIMILSPKGKTPAVSKEGDANA